MRRELLAALTQLRDRFAPPALSHTLRGAPALMTNEVIAHRVATLVPESGGDDEIDSESVSSLAPDSERGESMEVDGDRESAASGSVYQPGSRSPSIISISSDSSNATIVPATNQQPPVIDDDDEDDNSDTMSDNYQYPAPPSDASAGDNEQQPMQAHQFPHGGHLAQPAGYPVDPALNQHQNVQNVAQGQTPMDAMIGQAAHNMVNVFAGSEDAQVPANMLNHVVTAIARLLDIELPGNTPLAPGMPANLRTASYISGQPLEDTIIDGGEQVFGRTETAFLRSLVSDPVLLALRDRHPIHAPMPANRTLTDITGDE